MSEEKITSLVKMPNEENVDTSGLSFTNCIQNRFFFSFSSSPPPCKLTFGLKLWPKNVLSREEYVVSRQAMNLVPCFIFSLPRETLSLSSLKKKKFDTTSALQRLLSTMLKFCMIKNYDLASFYFFKKSTSSLGCLVVIFKLITTRNVVHAQFLHFSRH